MVWDSEPRFSAGSKIDADSLATHAHEFMRFCGHTLLDLTLNPESQTLFPKLQTLNPKPEP